MSLPLCHQYASVSADRSRHLVQQHGSCVDRNAGLNEFSMVGWRQHRTAVDGSEWTTHVVIKVGRDRSTVYAAESHQPRKTTRWTVDLIGPDRFIKSVQFSWDTVISKIGEINRICTTVKKWWIVTIYSLNLGWADMRHYWPDFIRPRGHTERWRMSWRMEWRGETEEGKRRERNDRRKIGRDRSQVDEWWRTLRVIFATWCLL